MARKSGKSKETALQEAGKAVINDVDKAGLALPPEERQAYRDVQQSVVDARRSAEAREGLRTIE